MWNETSSHLAERPTNFIHCENILTQNARDAGLDTKTSYRTARIQHPKQHFPLKRYRRKREYERKCLSWIHILSRNTTILSVENGGRFCATNANGLQIVFILNVETKPKWENSLNWVCVRFSIKRYAKYNGIVWKNFMLFWKIDKSSLSIDVWIGIVDVILSMLCKTIICDNQQQVVIN